MLKYLRVMIFLCVMQALVDAYAITRVVNFEVSGSNVTEQLRMVVKGMSRRDSLVINFAKGEFIIDGSVEMHVNTVMRGQGKDVTRLLFGNTGTFGGDSFLYFNGNKRNELSVEISDLSCDMVHHDEQWWDTESQKYLLRFIHIKKADIHHIASHLMNAACTTIDMIVCRNVDIHDCELINHNNCGTGGILWFRRDNHDIKITDNVIEKYGDDEFLAIWEGGDDNNVWSPEKGIKENILFANNQVRFIKHAGDKDRVCSVQMALYNFGTDKGTAIHWSNIVFENNSFYFDAPILSLLSIRMNSGDSHEGMVFRNNQVTFTAASGFDGNSHADIEVHDAACSGSEVFIEGNVFTVQGIVTDRYGGNGYNHLICDGATVRYSNNDLSARHTTIDGKTFGPTFLWVRNKGCDVTLTDNDLSGMVKLAKVDGGETRSFKLSATGNTFSGDTRIYCRDVQYADVSIVGNTFNSDCYEVLLQEFASRGKLVFKDNVVYASRGGRLFTHYDKKFGIDSMVFERLEVSGNTLNGMRQENFLPQGMNVTHGKVKNNRFY